MDIQNRLLRIFKLIRLLNTPPAKNVALLRQRLGVSRSEMYRLFELLKKVGYPVEKNDQNRYLISFPFSEKENSVLSVSEQAFLQEHLQHTAGSSPDAQAILHKFNLHMSLIPLADALPQLHASRILSLLRGAVAGGYCIKLKGYRSLTSNTILDRLVEPLEITLDYRYLIAWDLEKDDQRQFKINRIEDVEKLEKKVSPRRYPSPMDMFGLTGDDWTVVRMRLSDTAYHLLVEEFPLSRASIRDVRQERVFEGMVRNWKGVGRFVLGLPGEIEVLEPEAFKNYLKERMKEY